MAGNAARRARRLGGDEGEELDVTDDIVDDRPVRTRPPLTVSILSWVNQGNREDSSLRMVDKEPLYSYIAAVILTVIPFVFIVGNATHQGKPLSSPILQAVGLVAALAAAASVRLANRIVTPLLAIVSVLFTGSQTSAVPTNLRSLGTIDLLVGLGLVMFLTLRQSRARGAKTAQRRAAKRGTATPAGKRGAPAPEAAGGPARSRRYTPPKKTST